MNLEQLQAENLQLKTDLKTVKDAAIEVAKGFGLVGQDGELNEKFKMKDILAELTQMMQAQMMPKIFGGNKENSFEKKVQALTSLKPIFEKYKDL